MNTSVTIPVTRIVNAATRFGHAAIDAGSIGFAAAAGAVSAHSDVLQNGFLNRITHGRAGELQAPLQGAIDGALAALPTAVETAHEGVRVAGVAGKQFGWAANNVIRATDATTIAEAQAKLELATRQYDRGMDRVQDLRDLFGAAPTADAAAGAALLTA
ncbi:MAG: hypothetical protein JWM98_1148 [Thermoleophilia bacterium]|nr:hypothetical protein [Thermoleophilia bacterium]